MLIRHRWSEPDCFTTHEEHTCGSCGIVRIRTYGGGPKGGLKTTYRFTSQSKKTVIEQSETPWCGTVLAWADRAWWPHDEAKP